MKLRLLLLPALLGCGLAAAETRIYKWTDENGVVHFSESPRQGATLVTLTNVAAPPAEQAAALAANEATQARLDEGRTQRDEAQSSADEARQLAEAKRERCQIARDEIAYIEPRTNLLVRSEDGQTRRLGDEERLERLAEARKVVEENC